MKVIDVTAFLPIAFRLDQVETRHAQNALRKPASNPHRDRLLT